MSCDLALSVARGREHPEETLRPAGEGRECDPKAKERAMAIANYSVLTGKPTAGKVVTGASRHYQITVASASRAGTPAETFTVAVNIESVDGSEVLYAIEQSFTPPDAAGLASLATGVTALQSEPGGLALDYVREEVAGKLMITRAAMTPLPKAVSGAVQGAADEAREVASRALENAVVALLDAAIAAGDAVVYAFGSAYADGGVVDGIHDIHMNQGNPVSGGGKSSGGGHGGDNGVWQDGALFLEMGGMWTAVFLAFQTESWVTDAAGDPAATVHRHHAMEG